MLDLVAEQARLEQRMATLGAERYRALALEAREGGEATRSKSVSYAMDATVLVLGDAVSKFLESAQTGRAGRKHSAVRALEDVDPTVAAFITAKTALDGVAKKRDMVAVASLIGTAIETEKRIANYRLTHPGHVGTVEKDLNRRTRNGRHRKSVFNHVLSKVEDGWTAWDARAKVLVGTKLIELMVEATGLFEIERIRRGRNKYAASLVPTNRVNDWLATLDIQAELLSPEFRPCVIPPKDWEGLVGGGYHTDAFATDLSLVKTRSKDHLKALASADLSNVYRAVNAIQRTPWAVNRRVLEVASHLNDAGGGLAGLPQEAEHIPTPPADIDTNEEARTRWKRQAAMAHDRNRTLFSRRVQTLKTLSVAQEYVDYDAIYFPHQLDFRGRVYAVPNGLNPQGTDLAKGLLQFSEGDPLDTVAAIHWFKVHGANTFGVDKVGMDDRLAWVDANSGRIAATAREPLDDLWWAEADSPFCFLAWCFEYAAWLMVTPYGGTFCSRLAIAMDGSCNGLQHYSAMLRDPVAGKAVNLVPSDAPQDIYGEVARVVNDRLYQIAMQEHVPGLEYATDEERKELMEEAALANHWGAFGIDRKITKRPVMVLPYGGTLNSCQKYVFDAVLERSAADIATLQIEDDQLRAASYWLGGVVWSSIGDVVVSAKLAMGWLRETALIVAKSGNPLKWTTPSGFVVVQGYQEVKSRQIETVLFGKRFKPCIQEAVPDTIDRRRQANGVAPNFVHSMDAAALILTVNAASEKGITKFAMIHDSYGTTASGATDLASVLRSEFVRMYEENEVLEQFREETVPASLQDKVQFPPFVGGLDLHEIKESDYFFA
ncbi:DNA-directed RNA polymerase [Parasphingorhabdus sp.]|uniref:DNA-directed RNA polymerase n=1 Tax=Parasphingorhabdus sp. TaxID=2709688 RepID=UPI003A8E4B44